jgi:putative DNA primase/helicase
MSNMKQPQFAPTDAGNAEMFADLSKDDLRYDHKQGQWLVWRGNWWSEDKEGEITRRAKAVARLRAEQAQGLAEDDKNKKLEAKWALESEMRPRLEAMLKLATSEKPLSDSGEGWDADPMLLGVTNGVIDLQTGTLRDGRPEDKITLHTEIPFQSSTQCPRWVQFLEEIFDGDRDLVEYTQRAVGYCLTGDTREQCLFLCHGSGANGKSTFLEAVRYMLGGYEYNLPFSAFELDKRSSIPNDLAPLPGKRFVTAIETNENAQLNEGRIKLLTGCDPISARYLRREFFSFVPVAKYWLAFNNAPAVTDDSHGFWRRIRLIPFLKQFDDTTADRDLLAKLKVEAPGILAWAVRGCLEWQRRGLGMPPAIKEATEEYRQENDPLADFIEDRCVVALGAVVSAANLWQEYRHWERENATGAPLNRRRFSRRLEVRGFQKTRQGHDRTWVWLGIALKPGEAQPEPWTGGPLRTDADVKIPFVVS